MKSGLEDRNNALDEAASLILGDGRLNEVRPGRPEQWSGQGSPWPLPKYSLNEVRPGRPEQYAGTTARVRSENHRLNEVRPGRPEQSWQGSADDRRDSCLNEVRPGRPEQFLELWDAGLWDKTVSMKSGLEDRNNLETVGQGLRRHRCLNEVRPGRPEQSVRPASFYGAKSVSMKSGLEDRNNPC